jgi:uncharacterized membrane protein
MPPVLGPIELLVVDFAGNHFKGELLPELERLKESDIVRLVDLLIIRKDHAGAVLVATATDLGLDEMLAFGAKIGALIGSGVSGEYGGEVDGVLAGLAMTSSGHVFDEAEAQKLGASLPNNYACAVVFLEHRWALPFRAAIDRAEGKVMVQEWLSAETLAELGTGVHHRGGNGNVPH